MIKTYEGLGIGIERNFLNLTKGIYKKLTGNIMLTEEDWNLLLCDQEEDVDSHFSHFYSALCWMFWPEQFVKKMT